MRILVTGASGYIGNAVAQAFSRAGHDVSGLIRSKDAAKKLHLAEITPVIGNLNELETYAAAVERAEVIVHCAFEFSPAGIQLEAETLAQITRIGKKSALKTLIYTSGIWVYGNTYPHWVDEASPLTPIDLVKWRVTHEQKVLTANSSNFRTLVIRPGCVYGGKGGLTAIWFADATNGKVELAGDGNNYWSMIHLDDLANGYVLAAEHELAGMALNITDGRAHSVREMAEAVAKISNGKINYLSHQAAEKRWGDMAKALMLNQCIDNQRAKRLLNWHPGHRGFAANVEQYYYAWKNSQV